MTGVCNIILFPVDLREPLILEQYYTPNSTNSDLRSQWWFPQSTGWEGLVNFLELLMKRGLSLNSHFTSFVLYKICMT